MNWYIILTAILWLLTGAILARIVSTSQHAKWWHCVILLLAGPLGFIFSFIGRDK